MQMRVGGSVKTRLSKDRNLLVWRWRHVSAVLGHLQVISYLQLTIVKRKHIHRHTYRYCVFVVFNEISLLTGLCFTCTWLRLYKYVKSVLNWKTSLKNWKKNTSSVFQWRFPIQYWLYIHTYLYSLNQLHTKHNLVEHHEYAIPLSKPMYMYMVSLHCC